MFGFQARAFGEVTAFIFAAISQQQLDTATAKLVEFVDRAQHRHVRAVFSVSGNADCFEQTVQHLAVVDTDAVVPAWNAKGFQHISTHHAHLGIRRDDRRADDIGVKLCELAEASGAGLFIAPHGAGLIAAEGLGQSVVIFSNKARERRGQVIAQRQPLLVIVLKGKHAFIGAVFVGQELAERVGIFKGRCFQRIKAVALIDGPDFGKHLRFGAHLRCCDVAQPLRHACLGAEGLCRFGHGSCRSLWLRAHT